MLQCMGQAMCLCDFRQPFLFETVLGDQVHVRSWLLLANFNEIIDSDQLGKGIVLLTVETHASFHHFQPVRHEATFFMDCVQA